MNGRPWQADTRLTLASDSSPPQTVSFDAAGNYVLGPPCSDPCVDHTTHGLYGSSTTALWILLSDRPPYDPCGGSEFTATWAPGSTTFQMSINSGNTDNCTGNGPFNMGGVLTKRK
jgi:hypothetical protein